MRFILITLMISCSLALSAQHESKLQQYLKEGNTKQLSVHFNSSIDMNLPEHKGIYQKEQASMLLGKFFDTHPPSSYEVKHQGGSKQRSSFQIGKLKSGEKVFRTYILYNSKDDMLQIIELRIEEE